MIDYIVSVINEFDEQMTFRFKELHDAITLYTVVKHDETVTYVTVDSVEFDESDPDIFTDSQAIRVYERE